MPLSVVAAGKEKGNVDLQEALAYAQRAGQDLVQLGYNPRDDIARCVIISYTAFLNRQTERKKKAPKQPKVKTARFREDITSNDILTKAKQTKKWIAKGLQVGPCAGTHFGENMNPSVRIHKNHACVIQS